MAQACLDAIRNPPMLDTVLRRLRGAAPRRDYAEWRRSAPSVTNIFLPHLAAFLDDAPAETPRTVYLTEGDCHLLARPDLPWKTFLDTILADAHTRVVCHTSHNVARRARLEVEDLRTRHPQRFELRTLAPPHRVEDPKERTLIEALDTFHPNLAWVGTDGTTSKTRFMWIERWHPRRQTIAYGCDYWAPRAVNRCPQDFHFFLDALDRAWKITNAHRADAGRSDRDGRADRHQVRTPAAHPHAP